MLALQLNHDSNQMAKGCVCGLCRTCGEVGLDALEGLGDRHEGEGLHLPITIVRAEVRRQLQVIPIPKFKVQISKCQT